jgi:HEPN domain-containing protein
MTVPESELFSDYMRQRSQEWFVRAEQLLSLLDCAPFEKDRPPTNMSAVLSFMVVEYVLKGYLMLFKVKIPASHDLGDILNRCLAVQKDPVFETIRPLVEDLACFRVEMDYPGIIQDTVTVEEARHAIYKARQIYDYILAKTRMH